MANSIVPKDLTSATYYVQHPIDLVRGLSSDVVAFIIIFLALASYGLYRGKENIISLILSSYLAVVAYSSSDFLKSLVFLKENNTQIFFSKAIVFLILVIITDFFVVKKIVGFGFPMSKVRNWIEVAGLSVALTASLVVIAFNFLSLSLVYSPSLLSVNLLASSAALFWTLIGSLVIIFFATR